MRGRHDRTDQTEAPIAGSGPIQPIGPASADKAKAARRDAGTDAPPSVEPLAVRGFFVSAVLLLLLLVVVDLWANHHLGLGFTNPGWLAGFFAVFSALAGWVEKQFEESEGKALKKVVRRWTRKLFSPRALAVLYGSAAILVASTSSVMVVGYEPDDVDLVAAEDLIHGSKATRDRAATASGTEGTAEKGTPHAGGWRVGGRLFVITGPFGRDFELAVPGYLSTVVDVRPIVGQRIVPDRDLEPTPSLLLRPPLSGLRALALCDESSGEPVCGTLEAWTTSETGDRIELARWRGGASASVLLTGGSKQVPSERMVEWRMELLGLGFSADDRRVPSTLLHWKRPVLVEPTRPLEPGMVVEVVVRTKAGVPVASAQVHVERSTFQDVLMTEEAP